MEQVSLVYTPDKNSSHKRMLSGIFPARNIAEFEKRKLADTGIHSKHKLNACLALDANSKPSKINVEVEDANKHKSVCEIYADGSKSCTCEQYFSHECSYCKHLALIDFLFKSPSFLLSEEEREFQKSLKRMNTQVVRSKASYSWFDSRYQTVINPGSLPSNNMAAREAYVRKHTAICANNTPMDLSGVQYSINGVSLYDYQQDILRKMLSAKRCICSMVMGAGKTLTTTFAVAHLDTLNSANKVLIVCPKSVMRQWEFEIRRILGRSSVMIDQKTVDQWIVSLSNNVGITTYQFFTRNYEKLCKQNFDVVVADEIQNIRNNESKIWSAFKKINTTYFFGLSGTVIENRIDDLYNIMEVINPSVLPIRWKFEETFKVVKSINRNKVIFQVGIRNVDKLKSLISGSVFSYDKLELPKKNSITRVITLSKHEQLLHNEFLQTAAQLIAKSATGKSSPATNAIIQSLLLRARQACNCSALCDPTKGTFDSEKLKAIEELVVKICKTDKEKLVLFSEWTSVLDIIEKILHKHGIVFTRLDGSMTTETRSNNVNRFITDPNTQVFLSSDAGGLGVDGLQKVCRNVAHVELPWNPAKIDQRNGRLHRLLQNKEVNVYYFYARGTIEERIHNLLQEKREVRLSTLF